MTKYLTWPTHESVDVTRKVIENWIQHYQYRDFYQWAIVLKETQEVIGTLSIVHMNEKINSVCIGYCIGSRFWKKGYVSEAFEKVIRFLFEDVKVNRIESHHDVNNPASGRVMQKCGMTCEGISRQADYNNQGIVDIVTYGYIAEDYFKKVKLGE